jgi:hypothetical protein
MRMDRPNGVHNEERTFLDRITQLKSILRNRCGDGRWSCHLDGAVLAGRSGTRDSISDMRLLLWRVEKRVYGDITPGHQPDKRIMVLRQPVGVVVAITPRNWSSPPEKKPQKRGFLTRSDRLPLLGSHLGPRWLGLGASLSSHRQARGF